MFNEAFRCIGTGVRDHSSDLCLSVCECGRVCVGLYIFTFECCYARLLLSLCRALGISNEMLACFHELLQILATMET